MEAQVSSSKSNMDNPFSMLEDVRMLKTSGFRELENNNLPTLTRFFDLKKALCPLLHDSLDALNMLPTRDGNKVAQILEKLGVDKCFQDASERLINRPKDQDTQEVFYSGKKKPIP